MTYEPSLAELLHTMPPSHRARVEHDRLIKESRGNGYLHPDGDEPGKTWCQYAQEEFGKRHSAEDEVARVTKIIDSIRGAVQEVDDATTSIVQSIAQADNPAPREPTPFERIKPQDRPPPNTTVMGDDDRPPTCGTVEAKPGVHPVDMLRRLAVDWANDRGLEVDHASFDAWKRNVDEAPLRPYNDGSGQ